MKLTILFIMIVIVQNSSGIQSHSASFIRREPVPQAAAQEESKTPTIQTATSQATIQELQNRFKQIDREAGSTAEVELSGETESSAKLTVSTNVVAFSAGSREVSYEFNLGGVLVPEDLITNVITAIFSRKDNPGSLEGVQVKQIGATAKYEVVADYTYQWKNYRITVPKGFVYDRASIPSLFWIIIDKDSLSNVAPLFHDLLYRHGGKLAENLVSPYRTFSREDADELFSELMTKCGVRPWRRVAAYRAVRQFSQAHWRL